MSLTLRRRGRQRGGPWEGIIRLGRVPQSGAVAPVAPSSVVETEGSPSALNNPQFRLLFIGNVVTMLGFGMMQVVQGVLAFDLTGKNSSVGFVAMGMGIPMLLLGPIGGALSDRLSKRMLLMFGQTAIFLVFFVVGLLTVMDQITIWILAGLTLILGCTFAVLMPARQAWVGDLLRGPQLAHGVALQQLSMNATRIVGPLAAGAMVGAAFIGTGGTYIVMSMFFLVSLGLLFLMQPTSKRLDHAATSVFGDIKEGARYVWGTPEVRLLMLMFGGVVLSAFSYMQLMPGLLENELGQDANRVGIIYGTTAVGGIGLTLYLTQRALSVDASRLLMFACGAGLAGAVILLALAPTFPLALGAAVLVGATSSGFQMANQVNLMQRTEPAFFGRVMSLTMTAFGLQMIVGFPAGALADQIGERTTLALLGVLCFVIVVIGTLSSGLLRSRVPATRGPLPADET
jgi:MFS family permease